jgi:hypothetical protein
MYEKKAYDKKNFNIKDKTFRKEKKTASLRFCSFLDFESGSFCLLLTLLMTMMTSASSEMFADHVTGCGCCGSAQQLTHESGTTVKGPRNADNRGFQCEELFNSSVQIFSKDRQKLHSCPFPQLEHVCGTQGTYTRTTTHSFHTRKSIIFRKPSRTQNAELRSKKKT